MDHEVKIHTIEEEEDEKIDINDSNLYRSCCNVPSDKRLLTFIAMFSISIITLGFSFSQIARGDIDKEKEIFYTGLISLIVGIWVRSPV